MTDRKARLAALAAKAGRTKLPVVDAATQEEQPQEEEPTQQKKLKFRNYTPANAALDEDVAPPSKRPRSAAQEKKQSVLEVALEKARAQAPVVHQEQAAAPKKINWDLKRDIAPKLAKLEKRTQKAIVQLLRERLAKEAADDID